MGYTRRYVTANVNMHEHRPRYTKATEAWAYYGTMADVGADLTIPLVPATDAVVGYGKEDEIPTAQFVGSGLDTFICRPYIVDIAAHRVDGDHYLYMPPADVNCIEEKGERWGLTWVRQRNMKKPDGPVVLRTVARNLSRISCSAIPAAMRAISSKYPTVTLPTCTNGVMGPGRP